MFGHCERAPDREGQLMLQMAELGVARDVSKPPSVWHRRQHNAQPFDVAMSLACGAVTEVD